MKILFQGDSITDCGRDKRNYHDLGPGYPKYAAELIREGYPDIDFEFINFGIGGNRTSQLFDRLYTDGIAFQPDVISFFIGINDIWHRHDFEKIATTDEQTKISSSVAAGYSEHHTGLVFSLSLSKNSLNMEMSEYADFLEMCHLYGFIQRYPDGKSKLTGVSNYGECLRYVGVAHATYMAENGLCLEEYVDLLRKNHTSTKGTDGKHLAVDTNRDGTADYAVYYVPKNGSADLTTVYIPSGMSYTVSGDNMGGFIVTVTLNS